MQILPQMTAKYWYVVLLLPIFIEPHNIRSSEWFKLIRNTLPNTFTTHHNQLFKCDWNKLHWRSLTTIISGLMAISELCKYEVCTHNFPCAHHIEYGDRDESQYKHAVMLLFAIGKAQSNSISRWRRGRQSRANTTTTTKTQCINYTYSCTRSSTQYTYSDFSTSFFFSLLAQLRCFGEFRSFWR